MVKGCHSTVEMLGHMMRQYCPALQASMVGYPVLIPLSAAIQGRGRREGSASSACSPRGRPIGFEAKPGALVCGLTLATRPPARPHLYFSCRFSKKRNWAHDFRVPASSRIRGYLRRGRDGMRAVGVVRREQRKQ